jgi:hypothetical protein
MAEFKDFDWGTTKPTGKPRDTLNIQTTRSDQQSLVKKPLKTHYSVNSAVTSKPNTKPSAAKPITEPAGHPPCHSGGKGACVGVAN